MPDGLAGVPFALRGIFYRLEEPDIVTPRLLCNNLLHKFGVGVSLRESVHIFEVAKRQTGHLGKIAVEISGQAINDLRAPALPRLSAENISADAPIEQDQFTINCEG